MLTITIQHVTHFSLWIISFMFLFNCHKFLTLIISNTGNSEYSRNIWVNSLSFHKNNFKKKSAVDMWVLHNSQADLSTFSSLGKHPVVPMQKFILYTLLDFHFLAAKPDNAMASCGGPDAQLAQNDRSPLIFTSGCMCI